MAFVSSLEAGRCACTRVTAVEQTDRGSFLVKVTEETGSREANGVSLPRAGLVVAPLKHPHS